MTRAAQPVPGPRELYLTMRGWRMRAKKHSWCWYKPPLRGTFYRLRDAYDVQMALDKETGKK